MDDDRSAPTRSARWRPRHCSDWSVVGSARTWAVQALPGLLRRPVRPRLRADLELLLSELATNALRHGGGLREVCLQITGSVLRVSVHDNGQDLPLMRDRSDELEHGRGMVLIEAIAVRWGVQRYAGDGKDVWLELAVA